MDNAHHMDVVGNIIMRIEKKNICMRKMIHI